MPYWRKIWISILVVLLLGIYYVILTGRLMNVSCMQPPCYTTGRTISSCSVLDQAGEIYYLTADIINTSSGASGVGPFDGIACMHVTAANVTIDCQGHLIDGVDIISETYGVYSDQFNTTIKNCVFTDWNNPIIWCNIADSGGTISNVRFSGTQNGIFLYNVNNVMTENIRAYSNDIALAYVGNNITLKDSKIYDNNRYGIVINGMNGGSVFNNLFNNSVNVDWVTGDNSWNATNQPGTRIYGSGTQTGGNYWGDPTHTAYTDTCNDTNNDSFCDEPYDTLNGVSCTAGVNCSSNTDYLPLTGAIQHHSSILS
jgi:hypothetical protein